MIHWTNKLSFIAALAAASMLAAPNLQASDSEPRHGRMHQDGGHDHRLFVTVTGAATQDRAMPLVLANQAIDKGLEVRVLLCGDGAMLAVASYQAETFAPRDISAQDLLKRLMNEGATVEVCAIFLPNTEFGPDDLIEGIGIAQPGEVAAYMMGPRTRILSH
ncbi:MAG: DsrE family protein [Wenzhouxiangella sp.]